MTDADKKAIRRARYLRHCARNRPVAQAARVPRPQLTRLQRLAYLTLRDFVAYMQQVVMLNYGDKGEWGHGLQPNGTRKGPGIRPLPRKYRLKDGGPLLDRDHPAGTKLVRRFIRQSRGEARYMRETYAILTGKHYA